MQEQILSELVRIRECLERMESESKKAQGQSPQVAMENVQQIMKSFGMDGFMPQGDK